MKADPEYRKRFAKYVAEKVNAKNRLTKLADEDNEGWRDLGEKAMIPDNEVERQTFCADTSCRNLAKHVQGSGGCRWAPSSELVERLREADPSTISASLCDEVADRIEALEAELSRYRGALEALYVSRQPRWPILTITT